MKKKVFIMLPCTAAVAIATFICKKSLTQSGGKVSDLLLQNVEALAQKEDSVSELHYSNIHIACFKTTNYGGIYVTAPDGNYSASCFINENSNKGYHQHFCSSCSSY